MAQLGYPNNPPLQVPAKAYGLMISHQLGRPLALYQEKPSALVGVILLVVGGFCELSLLPFIFLVGLLLSTSQISVADLLTLQGLGLALFFLLCVLFGILIGRGGFRLLTGPFQHLYLCEEGLVCLTGRREIAMRWDQVTSVVRPTGAGRRRKGVSSKPLECRLRRSDGAELTIHERYFEQGDAVCGFIQQEVARANNFRRG